LNKLLTFQDLDDDSEAEKLSPLLITDERSASLNLRAEDSVDDTDDVSGEICDVFL
jgi:hypothetical protein